MEAVAALDGTGCNDSRSLRESSSVLWVYFFFCFLLWWCTRGVHASVMRVLCGRGGQEKDNRSFLLAFAIRATDTFPFFFNPNAGGRWDGNR